MGNILKYTGGARVGWINATWPFASLTATTNQITLNVTLVGKYLFQPAQVISIEKYVRIPFFGWGIKINHNMNNYPSKIVFWCFCNPIRIIENLEEIGFLPRGDIAVTKEIPKRGGAIRWQSLVILVLIWNALFLLDHFSSNLPNREIGPLSCLAILLLFLGCISIRYATGLQKFILSPGRNIGEISHVVNLLTFISGLMTFVFLMRFIT